MDMSRFSIAVVQHSILLCFTLLFNQVLCQKTALMIKRKLHDKREPMMTHTESFRKLMFNANLALDHTLFIKEILEHPEKRLIIACPPKWCKSTNLHMVKMFLQMEIDDKGQQLVNINQTMVYKLFKYGEAFYDQRDESFTKPFLISKHQDIFDQHMCQYPVIHMRMRFVEGLNDVEAINNIRMMLRKVYTPHKYLVGILRQIYKATDRRDLAKKNKTRFYYDTFNRILEEAEKDERVLAGSLVMLCKLLYRQHRKRVVVLIDDYDLPFYKFEHIKHVDRADMKYVLKYLKEIISPILEENFPYVERAVLIGTYLFTDILGPTIARLPTYSLTNSPWLEYFTVSNQDFKLLCLHTGKTDEQYEQAAIWYMGYKIISNDQTTYGQLFSVGNFLSSNTLRLYLFRYLEFDYVYRLVKLTLLRKLLETMVNKQTIVARLSPGLRFNESQISALKDIAIFGPEKPIEQSTVDFIISYFCATGYLTFDQYNATTETYHVWIPNKESWVDIVRKLNAFYHKTYNISHVEATRFVFNIRDYMVSNSKKPMAGISIYLKNLFQGLDLFNANNPQYYTTEYYQNLLYDLLKYISLMWQNLVKVKGTVYTEPNSTAFYMLSTKDNRGLIIAAQYNQTAERLMEVAKSQTYRLKKYKHLQFHKFVVFALDTDREMSFATDSEIITKM